MNSLSLSLSLSVCVCVCVCVCVSINAKAMHDGGGMSVCQAACLLLIQQSPRELAIIRDFQEVNVGDLHAAG